MDITNLITQLGEVLAQIIEHEDCPTDLRNAITEFSCDVENLGDPTKKFAADLRGPFTVAMLSLLDEDDDDDTPILIDPDITPGDGDTVAVKLSKGVIALEEYSGQKHMGVVVCPDILDLTEEELVAA